MDAKRFSLFAALLGIACLAYGATRLPGPPPTLQEPAPGDVWGKIAAPMNQHMADLDYQMEKARKQEEAQQWMTIGGIVFVVSAGLWVSAKKPSGATSSAPG